jgi:membrane-associated protease RseP (regulator of RpoE activity)
MAVAESTVPGRWSIVEVVPDGPAAAVGIRPGDDLRAINGLAMASADDVSQALTAIAAGQTVRLSVARADQVSDLAIVAAPRPGVAVARGWQAAADSPPPLAIAPPPTASLPPTTPSVLATPRAMVDAASAPPAVMSPAGPLTPPPSRATMPAAPRGRTALGVRTVAIDPGIQERFRLPQAAGAYVVGVVGDLPASKAGIPPGSVIVALGDRPVRSPQELTQLVASGPTDRPLPVQYVLPGGAEKRAEVMLQSLDQPLEQALLDDGPMQPVAVPTLEPGPASRTARRPSGAAEPEQAELRREVGRLRAWLDVLERRLEQLGR